MSMNFVIEDSVLKRCKGEDERIIVPEGVKTIFHNAFFDCGNTVRHVVLPEGLECIDEYALSHSYVLESINLPESLVSLGKSAFSSCYELKRVVVPGSVKSIKANTFFECRSLEEVVLGDGIEDIGQYGFWLCGKLKKVTISTSLKHLYFDAFEDCKSLTTVVCDGEEYSIRVESSIDKAPSIVKDIAFSCRPRKREYYRALQFPAGYPYMDEQEYLNTGGEE